MTETVIRDDAVPPVATRPIERRGGVEYVGGTDVPVEDVLQLHAQTWEPGRIAFRLGLTHEQVAYVIHRAAKQARRKDPVVRTLKANGRACKQRGARAENAVVDLLGRANWERVPLSGALGGRHSGDVRYTGAVSPAPVRLIEVKRRRGGTKTLTKWLAQGGGVDALVIDPVNAPRLWVVPEATMLRLLDAAGLRGGGK